MPCPNIVPGYERYQVTSELGVSDDIRWRRMSQFSAIGNALPFEQRDPCAEAGSIFPLIDVGDDPPFHVSGRSPECPAPIGRVANSCMGVDSIRRGRIRGYPMEGVVVPDITGPTLWYKVCGNLFGDGGVGGGSYQGRGSRGHRGRAHVVN